MFARELEHAVIGVFTFLCKKPLLREMSLSWIVRTCVLPNIFVEVLQVLAHGYHELEPICGRERSGRSQAKS